MQGRITLAEAHRHELAAERLLEEARARELLKYLDQGLGEAEARARATLTPAVGRAWGKLKDARVERVEAEREARTARLSRVAREARETNEARR